MLRGDASLDATIDDAGVAADAKGARRSRTLAAIETVPRTVTLTYYDPARDYQTGMTEMLVEHYVVTLTLSPITPTTLAVGGSSGSAVAAADEVVGVTVLAAFETPALDDSVLAAPRLTVAATGTGVGWRRAALLLSTDGGASWTAAGGTAAPAVMGTLLTVPPPAVSTVFDAAGTVDVQLARPDLVLEDADDDRLDAGVNLAIAGDELIQFGRAAPLGGGRWRLSRLLRGRRGTEAAIAAQAIGDRFAVIVDEGVRAIDLPLAALGSEVRVMASGVGDTGGPVEARVAITGRSVLPPSPAHVTATIDADGAAHCDWVRRSRAGWRWIDGVDAPLAEEAEAYAVSVTRADGSTDTVATTAAAATVAGVGLGTGPVTIAVNQRGTQGLSLPATIGLNTGE